MADVLVTATDLAELMLSPTPPVILDVRWQLGDDDGRQHYRDGHLPGAIYVDLDTELAAPPAGAAGGRHPLPAVDDLQAAARRWGIDDDVTVVVYDDNGNLAAARAWWLLRWAGITDVRMLDGGLGAWRSAGLRTAQGDGGIARAGSVTLRPGQLPVADIDEVADSTAVLLDVRAAERYRGEVEPVDPRAGHIPGARNAPTTANLDADGYFRPAGELRKLFSEVGVDEGSDVIAYCGSGINAAHAVAALEIAGVRARLFPGSFSQWSSDPDRPVETSTETPPAG